MSSDKKILCVGQFILDYIHICDDFPDEDRFELSYRGHWQRGGNATNNCSVLRNLGADCEFLGVLSNAPCALNYCEKDFIKNDIIVSNCPKTEQDPIFSSIILNQKTKSRTIFCTDYNYPILKYSDFKKLNLDEYKWIHFEDRNHKETSLMIEDVIKYNQQSKNKIKMSLEFERPYIYDFTLTKHMDYIFLGSDFSLYFGWKDPKTAVYGLREKLENKNCSLICPWGAIGAAILNTKNEYAVIEPHPPKEIIDTLGAGDTFCAGAIFALSFDDDLKKAIDFANKVVGFKLSFYGYDGIKQFCQQK